MPSVKGTLKVINCFGFIICVLYSIVLLQLCSPCRRTISLHGGPLFVVEDASFSLLVYIEFNRKRTSCEQEDVSRMRAQSKELLPPTSANRSSGSLSHLKDPCKKLSLCVLKGEHGKGWIPSASIAVVNERTDVKLSNQAGRS